MANNERGAGRKPLPEGMRRERLVITLPPVIIERINNLKNIKNKKPSAVIEAALLAYLPKDE